MLLLDSVYRLFIVSTLISSYRNLMGHLFFIISYFYFAILQMKSKNFLKITLLVTGKWFFNIKYPESGVHVLNYAILHFIRDISSYKEQE